MWIAIFLVSFGIKEFTISEDQRKISYTCKQVLLHILKHPMLLIVMLMSMIVQIANFSIQPIFSLFVGELNGIGHIAFFSGLALS